LKADFMSDDSDRKNSPEAARDSFHAKRRRARRDRAQERREKAMGKSGKSSNRPEIKGDFGDGPCIYGLHTVRAALANPKRKVRGLLATRNALARLTENEELPSHITPEMVEPSRLDRLVGSDAVHQGVVLLTEPIEPRPFRELAEHSSILILDQVTDPHNVGAIMRSAVALGVGALVTTSRHSAAQTGVLAKSASGALDMIDFVEVTNLANAIEELHQIGFTSIGLDSEGPADMLPTLTDLPHDTPLAIVMGSEGKGLRAKTRETVTHLARLDMPGRIKSLNVSNAAALAMFCLHNHRQTSG
jgi:23S rRNA (guanosine2251-2'-O)-methyltransferase